MAQEPISSSARPWPLNHSVSQGRRCAAIKPGTRLESVIAKPWSPTVQVMASVELGKTHEPEARTSQAPADAADGGAPTTAAAPSANRALAIILCGSH